MARLDLSRELHEICQNVYFQPPESYKLTYPCIVYKISTGDTIYADNLPYRFCYRYDITVIDSDPDSELPLKVAMLPTAKMDRCFTSDNLYHSVFTVYR